MKNRIYRIAASLIYLCMTANASAAVPESFIERAFKAQESLVSVMALQHDIITTPKSYAARDTKTGRLMITKKARILNYGQTGGGIILTRDGTIATNFHTIQKASMVIVKLYTGQTFYAQITAIDPGDDIALLKISPPFALEPIQTTDSDTITLGDEIAVIGNSVYLKQTIAGGKITGIGHSREGEKASSQNVQMIQIDVTLYSGDSGDAVINKQGKLIGMITAELKKKKRTTFAVPVNKIKNLYLRKPK